MEWSGLDALASAATLLEKRAEPEVPTEREKRKMQAYIRRFDEMDQKQTQKKPTKQAKARPEHALLGKIVWKEFTDKRGRSKIYQGEVVSVSWTKKGKSVYNFGGGVTSTKKYLVEYTDGDSEDMPESVLLKYIVD
jgi:methionine salvage enolase-phosphatase E1